MLVVVKGKDPCITTSIILLYTGILVMSRCSTRNHWLDKRGGQSYQPAILPRL